MGVYFDGPTSGGPPISVVAEGNALSCYARSRKNSAGRVPVNLTRASAKGLPCLRPTNKGVGEAHHMHAIRDSQRANSASENLAGPRRLVNSVNVYVQDVMPPSAEARAKAS